MEITFGNRKVKELEARVTELERKYEELEAGIEEMERDWLERLETLRKNFGKAGSLETSEPPKDESMTVKAGYTPWSQRKALRVLGGADKDFARKVVNRGRKAGEKSPQEKSA